jgi:glycerate dehydrogenase
MKIVILDALTLGLDVDLSGFGKFGELKIYSTTNKNELSARIALAEIIITNKVIIGRNEFSQAPNLKLICVAATGYNNIDIQAAREKGVVVANVKNYSTESVAQHTFCLILALQNSLYDYVTDTRNGKWSESPIFTMLNYPFTEIAGKKLGIIGYGAIGKRVAEIGKAFGLEVLIGKRPGIIYQGETRVEFTELLSESDMISIHTPLSENTKDLFTIEEFKKMKKSSILINLARGGIVNEADLVNALSSGLIKAAAIDVCGQEPIAKDSELIGLKNLLITPHIAWASFESRMRLLDGIENNISNYLTGNIEAINIAM